MNTALWLVETARDLNAITLFVFQIIFVLIALYT